MINVPSGTNAQDETINALISAFDIVAATNTKVKATAKNKILSDMLTSKLNHIKNKSFAHSSILVKKLLFLLKHH